MRCFYDLVLHRECEHLGQVLPRSLKAIRRPQVYSIQELERLFTIGCVHPKHRMFLMTIYGGGLRLGEGCRLQPRHIDSARMQIRIERAKGAKTATRCFRHGCWQNCATTTACSAPKSGSSSGATRTSRCRWPRARRFFYIAQERAGLPDKGGIHSLRQNAECRECRARSGKPFKA